MPIVLPPLYPILDASCFPLEAGEQARFVERTVRELGAAGVELVQLRMKAASREELLRAADAARQAAPRGMRLILNDRAELVHEAGFEGVHVGQGDLGVAEARALLGPDAIVGLSAHTVEQVVAGEQTSVDYLAVGPVFATSSKADAEAAVGLAGVCVARAATRKPLVAIGGITLGNAREVWAAGADSVAVIGALFGGERPAGRIAEDFLRLFR